MKIIPKKSMRQLSCFNSLLVAFFIGGLPLAAADSYYVSTSGNDGASGSIGAPLRTIQEAVDRVSPGDTVLIRGGTYHPEIIWHDYVIGAAAASITFKAYANEKPVFDGERTRAYAFSIHNWGNPPTFARLSPLIFDGIEIKNYEEGAISGYIDRSTFKNLYIHDIYDRGWTGGMVANGRGAQGLLIRSGSNNLIENCKFEFCEWNGMVLYDSSYNIVRNCISWDNAHNGFDAKNYRTEPLESSSVGNVFTNNIAYDNLNNGIYVIGQDDFRIEYNLFYNNRNGIYVSSKNSPAPVGDNRIYRNTVLDTSELYSISIDGPFDSLQVKKNLFAGSGRKHLDDRWNEHTNTNFKWSIWHDVTEDHPENLNRYVYAHWPLDGSSSSTALDISGFANHGTATNTSVVTGRIGAKARQFDGVNDKINCGQSDRLDLGTSNFYISAWVKMPPQNLPAYSGILSKGAYSNTSAGYALVYQKWGSSGQGKLVFKMSNGSDRLTVDTSLLNLDDGQWHFIQIRGSRTYTCEIYVDAQKLGSKNLADWSSTASISNPSAPFMIGSWTRWAWKLNGSIDDIYVIRTGL